MNTLTAARIRRQWPFVAAALAVLAFAIFHQVVFGGLTARRDRALKQAVALGAALDPAHPAAEAPLPPRVFTLLIDNSMPAPEADQRNQSGALGAELVQAVSALASKHDLDVNVAEPGLSTQQAGSIQARAHLKLSGTYAGFVALVDDMTRGGRIWRIERFAISPAAGRRCDIELFVAASVLRRTGSAP